MEIKWVAIGLIGLFASMVVMTCFESWQKVELAKIEVQRASLMTQDPSGGEK